MLFLASDFPCVFGLLPDRKKNTYQTLFQELKNVAASMNRIFKPDRIISDFETGLRAAIPAEVIYIIYVNKDEAIFVVVSWNNAQRMLFPFHSVNL